MRTFTRVLATTVATAALTAGAFASSAAASPEDGEGCVGFPSLPATYVCVIAITPTGVVPTTSTTNIPVTVPEFCYAIDCVGPTTVNVPVPGVQPGSGVVATIWYDGVYYPIGVGVVPPLPGVGGVPGIGGSVINDFMQNEYEQDYCPILTEFMETNTEYTFNCDWRPPAWPWA